MQVKSRAPGACDDGSAWIAKHGRKAARQAAGTRRSIRMAQEQGRPLVALPTRTAGMDAGFQARSGLPLSVDASGWPSVIVIDHPAASGLLPDDGDCFWITLSDWRRLWSAVRSVTGVLRYVRRVLDAGVQVPLGEESSRFAAMCDADRAAHGQSAWLTTETYEKPVGAQLYRELIERVWPKDRPLPAVPMEDYRLVVDFLDDAAPGALPRLGEWILGKRREQAQRGAAGGLVLLDQKRVLVYKAGTWAGPESEQRFDAGLMLAALVRSAEASEQVGAFVPALAVGHLVGSDHVDYRYAYTRAPVEPTALERALVLHDDGALDVAGRGIVRLAHSGPGDTCPCGSGQPAGGCPASLIAGAPLPGR